LLQASESCILPHDSSRTGQPDPATGDRKREKGQMAGLQGFWQAGEKGLLPIGIRDRQEKSFSTFSPSPAILR